MRIFVLVMLLFLSNLASAESLTVLTLQRVNYKSSKRLFYDVIYDGKTCAINTAQPFDVYYRDLQSGARLQEFSEDSQNYFGPRIDPSKLSTSQVALQFHAFDEAQEEIGSKGEILISMRKVAGKCATTTEISYAQKHYFLSHIDIKLKKAFGIPTGLEWMLLKGTSPATGAIADCVVGNCK